MLQQKAGSATAIVSYDIAEFLKTLHPLGGVFEVRSPKCPDRKGGTYTATASGYFADANAAAEAINSLDRVVPPAVYCTLNPINPALIGRAANRINAKSDKTTNDADVTGRRWLFVDIDSKRPSGVSATDRELEGADQLSDSLLNAMCSRGWPDPLQMMSGNGRYLIWSIDLPNDNESRDLVKATIESFAREFDTDLAEVDCSTFNAARIIKVAGTVARKGDAVVGIAGIEDRPHRKAWFIPPAGPLEVVPRELLEVAAAAVAEPEEVEQKPSQKIDEASKLGSGPSDATTAADKYIAKMEPSISGSGGGKRLFAAACKAVHKFNLSDTESLAVLERSFNPRCEPDWETADLLRAIAAAKAKGQPEESSKGNTDVSGIVGSSGDGGSLKDAAPESVGDEFLSLQQHNGVLTLRNWSGSYWKWLGGRYVEITKEDVRSELIRFLRGRYCDIKSQDVNNVLMNVGSACGLMSCISMPRWLDGGDEVARTWRPEDTFSTKSEILHLPSLVAMATPYSVPATPSYFTGVATDYAFDPTAKKPERWLQFLDELFGDDVQSIELLRQWFGYCLTADTRQQKIMLMVGPKRSGKGTIARIMRTLVGDLNCCAPTLAGLATNFGLQALLGKTLAIIGDARLSGRTDVAATTERLLSISGEDAQTIDRKHKEPITTQLRTRFTIISNELPRLNDASGALAGRLLILKFTNSFFGREDKGLSEALHDERQGILMWAVGGWQSLRQAGRFIEPDASKELVDQMSDIASPITAFVGDCCEVDPLGESFLSDLYSHFRQWSEANGIDHPVSLPVFSRDLTAAYPQLHRGRTRSGAGPAAKARTIKGIRLGGE